MCRRNVIPARGVSVYRSVNRPNVLAQLPNPFLHWQMSILYREYDMLRTERVAVHRLMRRICHDMPEVQCLTSIPGIGCLIAHILVGWIVHPDRFASRSKLPLLFMALRNRSSNRCIALYYRLELPIRDLGPE
ncbi:hypothetical protein J7L05_00015 [bacterium]|nr:hypothetical protein [bacterium]